ncbi:unnamed protein product [Bemisia tabaci]|uniref:Uncharacterized protein n=2 Tax=Bemisia tabaci TaxID=7038 RepID=A0A9P0A4G9_BEMTA|nr:unnamed protein product [Bemisia tabaci]
MCRSESLSSQSASTDSSDRVFVIETSTASDSSSSSLLSSICERCSSSFSRKSYSWSRAIRKFNRFVALGVFLLSLVRIPSCTSTPIIRRNTNTMEKQNNALAQRPLWVNPCGYGTDETDTEPEPYAQTEETRMLQSIILTAKNALSHAKQFRDNYVKKTFNVDFEPHHDAWKSHVYSWLPTKRDIPKTIGEKLEMGYLLTLELDSALQNTYVYLQKVAVGLEQVVWDQHDSNSIFKNEFQTAEYELRAVLCEIQIAMYEQNIHHIPDVQRDIMTDDFRKMMNSSYRDLRDWFIFRDYMNALEYVTEVFEHFKQKIELNATAPSAK